VYLLLQNHQVFKEENKPIPARPSTGVSALLRQSSSYHKDNGLGDIDVRAVVCSSYHSCSSVTSARTARRFEDFNILLVASLPYKQLHKSTILLLYKLRFQAQIEADMYVML